MSDRRDSADFEFELSTFCVEAVFSIGALKGKVSFGLIEMMVVDDCICISNEDFCSIDVFDDARVSTPSLFNWLRTIDGFFSKPDSFLKNSTQLNESRNQSKFIFLCRRMGKQMKKMCIEEIDWRFPN